MEAEAYCPGFDFHGRFISPLQFVPSAYGSLSGPYLRKTLVGMLLETMLMGPLIYAVVRNRERDAGATRKTVTWILAGTPSLGTALFVAFAYKTRLMTTI